MCGRAYSTYTEDELEARYITQKRKRKPLGESGELKPNYNLAPTQMAPIVLIQDEEVTIELMRFGLIPFWAKDIKSVSQYSLINAKAEEISEKRSYKDAFQHRRCIVPLSGFYEWKKNESGPKQPYAIHLKDEPIISVAGIWEQWKPKDSSEVIRSFSIITTAANAVMEPIHNRMPVILERREESQWLNPANHDVPFLKNLLNSSPSERLEAYPVSTLVNAPKNNVPEVLKPLK